MKTRDIILSGILLVLIGVLLGMILSMVSDDGSSPGQSEVRVTEVNRSSDPWISRDDLEGMDSRFLFQTVASMVTPTVVFIEAVVPVRGRSVREETEESLLDRFMPRRIMTAGSGVIISDEGYILTNNHVIDGAASDGITVTLEDKRVFDANLVGADPSTDLAVLKIDGSALSPIVLGNSDRVEVGEWVLAIGNPFQLRSTVTAGIVSAMSRDVRILDERDDYRIESFIQTDAAINRGNSGGALVNTSGELIGINTAIATQSGNYQGYGFAVPSNLALKIASDLIEFGEVRRGLIGVSIASMDHRLARELGMDQIQGVLVLNLVESGAAYESGIRVEDVILEVNGSPVNESNQLQEKVAMHRPGDSVTLTIWRAGEIFESDVMLTEIQFSERRPAETERESVPEPEEEDLFRDGIESYRFEAGFTVLAIVNPLDSEQYSLVVSSVQRGSEAWNRGLRQDYEILEVDREEVASLPDMRNRASQSLAEDGSVLLTAETPDGILVYIELQP
ncbi:MAG: trypsin-like peptidase domain-containing protein [Balneolaceae bacterium]